MKPVRSAPSQKGLSIIEMMVAMAMGLVVLAGLLGVVFDTLRANGDSLKAIRLNQEIRTLMDLMVRDIRRSGYTSNYASSIGSIAVGSGLTNTLVISNNGNTINYQYDLNSNGTFDSNESFGFRLSNGTVQALNGGTWTTLSDPNVTNITSLTFCLLPSADNVCLTAVPAAAKVTSSGSAQIYVHEVRITLQGSLKADTSTSRKLVESVRVRNDEFVNP